MKMLRACLLSFCCVAAGLLLATGTSALAQTPVPAYRAVFTLHVTQPDQPASTQTFTVWLTQDQSSSVNLTREVPVSMGSAKIEYRSVGLMLNARLSRLPAPSGMVKVNTHLSISALAGEHDPPTIDQVSSDTNANAPLGRNVTIARFQTLTTHRTYQLDVLISPADGGEAGQ